jgi:hypothetical protein
MRELRLDEQTTVALATDMSLQVASKGRLVTLRVCDTGNCFSIGVDEVAESHAECLSPPAQADALPGSAYP